MHLKVTSIPKSVTITPPASKSLSNRELLICALGGIGTLPDNLSDCDDTRVVIEALDKLKSADTSEEVTIDVGAAGTSMRFLTAYLALRPGKWFITGSDRMKQRPIGILVDALRNLGAEIEYAEREGFPPLRIVGGKLNADAAASAKRQISLPGNVSSQFISALMMIAPYLQGGLKLTLNGRANSKPYINMTLKTMNRYGVKGTFTGNTVNIEPGKYSPVKSFIESDWSAASYWYAAAALCPGLQITLNNLRQKSLQGDAVCAGIAAKMGVSTTYTETGVIIEGGGHIEKNFFSGGFNTLRGGSAPDFRDEPDLAQTFIVLCCLKGIPFCFRGLESLKIKETDRISAIINEMAKVGFTVKTDGYETIKWKGGQTPLSAATAPIDTYEDHRMAMSMALCALKVKGGVEINNPEVVSKSYPDFWNDFAKILGEGGVAL